MDNRLHRLIQDGKRAPGPPTDQDLPEMAKGITAALRGNAKAHVVTRKGESYVRIEGVGINVVLYKRDWLKILPYLADRTLDTQLFPVEAGYKVSDPLVRYDASHIDRTDPLYGRVLWVLQTQFTGKIPTT
jgi:hypothetical protein